MHRLVLVFLILAMAWVHPGCSALGTGEADKSTTSGRDEEDPAHPPFGFDENARPSIETLLDDFLTALSNDDKETLKHLQVTEREYRGIIIPGRVPHGAPPRRPSDKIGRYFWEVLNAKSFAYNEILRDRFAGRTYERVSYSFTRPEQEHSWYNAFGELRMKLRSEDGREWSLETGYIAEVGGRFKFLSYEYD